MWTEPQVLYDSDAIFFDSMITPKMLVGSETLRKYECTDAKQNSRHFLTEMTLFYMQRSVNQIRRPWGLDE
jgi:hypothetical protein